MNTNTKEFELLLAKALSVSRSYLYMHSIDENTFTVEQKNKLQTLLERREQGEPIAYILGTQGFWSLELEVNPHTLIPRPCTELLVELALKYLPLESPCQVIDLGTGSGAIALALASERHHWQITASDKNPNALATAKRNAKRCQLDQVQFILSDWFAELPVKRFDAIISNPPYIKINDPHLIQGDLRFEPEQALVSGIDGLTALRKIIQESPKFLKSGGYLFLEHGYDQGKAVRNLMKEAGYRNIQQYRDLESHERAVVGRLN